jgi:Zn-dependent protease with chaperone function
MTFPGNVIVVTEQLADLPEDERLFVLAHELGHIDCRHFAKSKSFIARVLPSGADAPVGKGRIAFLKRRTSTFFRLQEFEADSYAASLLHRIGRPPGAGIKLFRAIATLDATDTHPAALARLHQLEKLQ